MVRSRVTVAAVIGPGRGRHDTAARGSTTPLRVGARQPSAWEHDAPVPCLTITAAPRTVTERNHRSEATTPGKLTVTARKRAPRPTCGWDRRSGPEGHPSPDRAEPETHTT